MSSVLNNLISFKAHLKTLPHYRRCSTGCPNNNLTFTVFTSHLLIHIAEYQENSKYSRLSVYLYQESGTSCYTHTLDGHFSCRYVQSPWSCVWWEHRDRLQPVRHQGECLQSKERRTGGDGEASSSGLTGQWNGHWDSVEKKENNRVHTVQQNSDIPKL